MRKKIIIIFNLFLFLFNGKPSYTTSAKNFSFYEFFINPNAAELILDDQENAQKPDLESVPEKVEIDE